MATRRTCRAAVFSGRESVEVREFAVPDPPPDGALLRVEAVGLCGSDLAQWHGLLTVPGMCYPIVPGHEIVGVVEKVGARAQLDVVEGDRVAVDEVVRTPGPLRVYGYTAMDDSGKVGLYGGYGEYIVIVAGTVLHRLTVDTAPEELTQFEPLASARNWVGIAGVRAGRSVVVQGPGHQGLAVVQSVFAAGATDVMVTGTTRDRDRLAVASALGAVVIDIDQVDVVDVVRERTGGAGADVVFDVTPATSTVALSLSLVRSGGTVLLAGLKEGRSVEIVSDEIVNRSLRVLGGTAFTPASLKDAVDLLNAKEVDTAPLRGAVLDLDHVDEAIDLLLRRHPTRDAVRVSLRHHT
jgi:2-desacetyl-2-hydroxyethyl bacteriochlorophyllide A dehydrogenase